jgi:two-component system, NtrC family, sensor kinase
VRLTVKLALALLPGALLVVAAAAALEVKRDRADFEADQRSDDRAAAEAFSDTMGKVWEAGGVQPVREVMERLRSFQAPYRVRWLDVDAALPPRERSALANGQFILWRDDSAQPAGWLHAASPVRVNGVVVGAVDVSEPPLDLRAHIGRTIRATVVTTLVLAATMMLMTLVVGAWLVGRPITGLIGQARRVAAGDLGARSVLLQRDELGDLTRELNKMLDRLESAGAEVQASTRKRLETLEQLRHAERLTTIGRLASSLAHELGTPLNVMTGRARLILEDEKESAVHARVIIDQGQRMAKIIRQLLDYARRPPAQRIEQDLCGVAADTVALLGPLATKKKIHLQFNQEVERAPVIADATQVQQALTNLIVNAIQASAEGATIEVLLRGTGEGFELAVHDQGRGMPPDVLARVFEPFFTTKPVGESTGLVLSVTRDIVDEHGGRIQAESAPGRGSRFWMFLPRRPA